MRRDIFALDLTLPSVGRGWNAQPKHKTWRQDSHDGYSQSGQILTIARLMLWRFVAPIEPAKSHPD